MQINTVTVIGANGAMGCNVSAIFAAFGNAKVNMVSRTKEKSEKAIKSAIKSVRADAIKEKLIPRDYSELEECIKESDLVFESVKEDLIIKNEINTLINQYANENLIIATGTSGLSVNALASKLKPNLSNRYLGMHFYNPPYNMTLIEMIPSDNTDRVLLDELKEYAKDTLYRTVVEIKDRPAFLGNRIGFQFINEALQYAEKYKDYGGIDYIDTILGSFTGRSMAPLVTSDFVGLDVHKAIVDNLYNKIDDYAKETFLFPQFAKKLVEENKLGKKCGCGLYKTIVNETKQKKILVYDINSGEYREKIHYEFLFIDMMIQAFRIGDYREAISVLLNNHSMEAELCLQFY